MSNEVTTVPATNAVDLFAAFAINETAEEQGIDTPLENCGSTIFRIARWQNKSFAKKFNALWKRNSVLLKAGGPEAEKKSDEMFISVMADTILLGWEGEIKISGKMYPYSKDIAKLMLAHKGFRDVVQKAAEDTSKFLAIQEEEALGN